MKRTPFLTIVLATLVGAGAAWFLEVALVAAGSPTAVPPLTLAVALGLIGVAVMIAAVPVRRAVRDRQNYQVDPFYATRIVVLAKASSIAGGLLGGAAIAILAFLLTRSVVAALGSILTAGACALGAIILLIGGLVAERMCSIPPEDHNEGDDNPATTRPL